MWGGLGLKQDCKPSTLTIFNCVNYHLKIVQDILCQKTSLNATSSLAT